MKTRRGFTLVELLVVIAIIALLMSILAPVLSRTREVAARLACGTNLSGIGKAMAVYAHDSEGRLPRAGGPDSTWGTTKSWSAPDRRNAFGLAMGDHGRDDGASIAPCRCGGGKSRLSNGASISSCFYLLVKYAEVTPKSFVCRSDIGTTEFRLSELPQGTVSSAFELTDAWDFGPQPARHCSYSYHIPFGRYGLKTTSEPTLAVAADRNPWIRSRGAAVGSWGDFKPDVAYAGGTVGTRVRARKGNTTAHQRDGQNVLFLDSHVEFAKRAYCAVEDDNIYTVSRDVTDGKGDVYGIMPTPSSSLQPANEVDSLLVHDPDTSGGPAVEHHCHEQ
jgi:prepilin-type N-terminal cleavage/methylation domain-containing protein